MQKHNFAKRFVGIQYMLPEYLRSDVHDLPSGSSMYKTYISMAIPSVLEMVLIGLINMIDTIMVSTLSTDAVAAVGLVGQPRLIMLCFFFSINTGITAVVARRKGESRPDQANAVLRNSLMLIVLMSAALMAIFIPLSEPLMRFAGAQEGRTLQDSTDYFRITTYVLPFNALSMGICAAQRGIGNTKLTMYVNITSNLVNVLFNYLLINGIGPFPKMGVQGAALATAIGLIIGFLLSFLSLFSRQGFLRFSRRDSWKPDFSAISGVVKTALSAMVEQIAMRIGFFSYAKIVAGLGTDVFAAHQIAMQFMGISFNFADGLGVAGTSLVGQMLGRRRRDLAHIYGTLAQRFSFLISLGIAAAVVLFRQPLVGMFIAQGQSDYVRHLAQAVLIVLALIQPFQMLSVVASGALRGAGDVRYTAKVMLLTVTLMRPTIALLAVYVIGNVLHLPDWALIGAWMASLFDMVTRMTLMLRRYRAGKWHNIKL